jgi:hypothetical protein
VDEEVRDVRTTRRITPYEERLSAQEACDLGFAHPVLDGDHHFPAQVGLLCKYSVRYISRVRRTVSLRFRCART